MIAWADSELVLLRSLAEAHPTLTDHALAHVFKQQTDGPERSEKSVLAKMSRICARKEKAHAGNNNIEGKGKGKKGSHHKALLTSGKTSGTGLGSSTSASGSGAGGANALEVESQQKTASSFAASTLAPAALTRSAPLAHAAAAPTWGVTAESVLASHKKTAEYQLDLVRMQEQIAQMEQQMYKAAGGA